MKRLQPSAPAENDLTDCFRAYRECARTVWNAFLRPYADGEHDFIDVDSALFSAMLLSQVLNYEPPRSLHGREYYDKLEIRSDSEGEVPVLTATEHENQTVWRNDVWSAEYGSLRYRGLFDFVTFSQNWREFTYVEAIVVAGSRPPFEIGRRVLLESSIISLLDVS